MNQRNFSDYLPAALIRDLRQTYRSPFFLISYALILLYIWLRSMDGGLDSVSSLAPLLLMIVIPLRAAQAVSADTRIRGTNFMRLTPLSSRRIVWGIWLSVFLQIALTTAILSLLVMPESGAVVYESYVDGDKIVTVAVNARGWHLQTLLHTAEAGLVLCAFFMFCSGLAPVFRYCLYGGCLLAAFGSMSFTAFAGMNGSYELASAGTLILQGSWAILLVVLFLELARRSYAPPAENCSVSVRLIGLLPLLIFLAMWGLGVDVSLTENQLLMALGFMVLAAVADAMLPCWNLPVHKKRCLPLLPKIIQLPGLFPSCLYMVLVAALGIAVTWLYVRHPLEGGYCDTLQAQIAILDDWHLPLLILLRFGLLTLYSLLVTVLLVDLFVRRGNPNRPVAFAIAALGLFLLAVACDAPGLPYGFFLESAFGPLSYDTRYLLALHLSMGASGAEVAQNAELSRALDACQSRNLQFILIGAVVSALALVAAYARPPHSRN